MANFDFLTEEDFRISLENDYREIQKAQESGSWKSLHVLAGSIVEAILADSLISIDYKAKTNANPLSMDLGQLIKAAEDEGILSSKLVALSHVIREYRNLIHPGRQIRLKETVDKNSSQVAIALVDMIVDEVSRSRRERHGYTAEQIVAKIEKDPSSLSILNHLLNETETKQIAQLLRHILPNRYMELMREIETILEDSQGYNEPKSSIKTLENLEVGFRLAFNKAEDETKEIITKHFIEIIKTEDQRKIFAYETAFFRCTDLIYVRAQEEIDLIKTHVLSRLREERSKDLLNILTGLGAKLNVQDIDNFIDPLVRILLRKKDNRLELQARSILINECPAFSEEEKHKAYLGRLADWINHLNRQEKAAGAEEIENIKNEITFPF